MKQRFKVDKEELLKHISTKEPFSGMVWMKTTQTLPDFITLEGELVEDELPINNGTNECFHEWAIAQDTDYVICLKCKIIPTGMKVKPSVAAPKSEQTITIANIPVIVDSLRSECCYELAKQDKPCPHQHKTAGEKESFFLGADFYVTNNLRPSKEEKKEPVDLGYNSVCTECNLRVCVCLKRNPDGSWCQPSKQKIEPIPHDFLVNDNVSNADKYMGRKLNELIAAVNKGI